MARISDKAIELAELLEVAPTAVEETTYGTFSINDDESEHDGEEYYVYTDEEAERAFKEAEEELIDELGIGAFSEDFRQWIFENAIDEGFLDDALYEEREYSEGEDDEDGVELIDDVLNGDINDKIQYFVDLMGEKDFNDWIAKYNAFDMDAIIDEVESWDGRGPTLASYDGAEEETENFYVYRIN